MSTFQCKPLPKHYSTSRVFRNEAERQRRDRLNHYVSELATLVPFVKEAKKRVDKTSILRLAASYLRLHKVLKNDKSLSKLPSSLNGAVALRELFNSVGGFFLVITNGGKIVYVSDAIEDSFGYTQSDVLGHSLYSFIHEEDRQLLRQQLKPKDSQRRSFYCRLMEKNSSRADNNSRYQIIHIMGHMKNYSPFSDGDHQSSQDQQKSLTNALFILNRKNKYANSNSSDFSSEDDTSSTDETSSNTDCDSHLFVAFVKVVKDRLVTELTWVESMRDEYITRHRLDGSMVHVDHRISFVTGFMPEEVLGKSAFNYMHPDDMCWSILAQKQMLLNGAGQGIVTYRLRCTDGSFIVLRSRGFLEVDKDTGKVNSFICINTLLTVNSATNEIQTQRKKLLPMLKESPLGSVEESIGSGLPSELKSLLMKQGNLKKFVRVVGSVMSESTEDVDVSKLMFDSSSGVKQNSYETIVDTPKAHHNVQFGKEIVAKKRSFNQGDISSNLRLQSTDTAVNAHPLDDIGFSPSHKKRVPSESMDFSYNSHSPPPLIKDINSSPASEACWSYSENATSYNKSFPMQNNSMKSSNWNKSLEVATTSNEYRNIYLPSVQPSYSEIQNWGYPNCSTDFSSHFSNKTSEPVNNCNNLFIPPNCNSSTFGTRSENGCQKRNISSSNHYNGISDP